MGRTIIKKPSQEIQDLRLNPNQHKCELKAESGLILNNNISEALVTWGRSGTVEFGNTSAWIIED